jgi:hypothetical protein
MTTGSQICFFLKNLIDNNLSNRLFFENKYINCITHITTRIF